MFFVGTAFYIYRNHIFLSSKYFLFTLILLSLSSINNDLFFIIYSISIPYLVFSFAYLPTGSIRKYNQVGDYSYGMYIYAFPVQQSIAAIIPDISVTYMAAIAFGITLVLAILSWHLVEIKCLKMKGQYVYFEKILWKHKRK